MNFSAALIVLLASGTSAFSVNNIKGVSTERQSASNFPVGISSGKSKTGENPSSTSLNVATITVPDIATKEEEIVVQEDQTSYLDDGFVFGLEGSGLERPKGKNPSIVLEGDNLETQPYQIAAVGGTFLGHAFFATTAIAQIFALHDGNLAVTAIHSMVVIVLGWLLSDIGSGILHWSVDNYGNGRTPIMGGIIAAFQGHHSAQWTITYRGFCNNVHKLCIPFGVPTVAATSILAGKLHPSVPLFFAVFCGLEILSQEFHKWAHISKGDCPAWVNWLQDVGLTIGRVPHSRHHRAPYAGNYCIVSGFWNEALDKSGFFRKIEHMVYKWNGIESNAWKLDPDRKSVV